MRRRAGVPDRPHASSRGGARCCRAASPALAASTLRAAKARSVREATVTRARGRGEAAAERGGGRRERAARCAAVTPSSASWAGWRPSCISIGDFTRSRARADPLALAGCVLFVGDDVCVRRAGCMRYAAHTHSEDADSPCPTVTRARGRAGRAHVWPCGAFGGGRALYALLFICSCF